MRAHTGIRGAAVGFNAQLELGVGVGIASGQKCSQGNGAERVAIGAGPKVGGQANLKHLIDLSIGAVPSQARIWHTSDRGDRHGSGELSAL